MAYEPKTKTTFKRGESGIAKVRFSEKGDKVQVAFQEDGKKYILYRTDCPDDLVPGEWVVSLSGENDTMFSFRPVKGVFKVTVKEFVHAENDEPKPKTKEVSFVRDGKEHKYSYDYFTVLFEILDPEKYKGLMLTYMLHYNFASDLHEGNPVVCYSMGGKYTDMLKEFLNVSGAWDLGTVDWKDNILPDLQRRILHANKQFQVTVKDGWIVPGSLIPMGEPEDDDMIFDAKEAEEVLERVNGDEFAEDEIPFEPTEEFEE